ncbi:MULTISPECIES: cyclodeaminase/cyclohydrolase family protein [Acidiplasma]|jgi:formiminotetrahydrofolate cyclodeaminase|uniref:Cyclodeaminase/cyclohydrolase domain-containing protein n=2 Tax=Acidiplasma TaxID=507753 RepID=A0A0Q0WKU9_9ARCH|nr:MULTISPECIES: cyclodeaminase/cyclohydrolase family protein [Acidiplasma]KJE49257.1 hypothetical protein TZ01_04110 [Acidiplasma sp. MBA-1]KPV44202.1 hypothetical protein SE19_08810 [Acidiplasma aeolicum]KQB34575.1 hypothetical protein AOG54_00835 [Acidiplasma aeolicum]KQB36363.1 hypothetical protein AOG55_00310 [Acidiplasma cupricumulans]WMT54773.1 MAG: cyclodeaminase/cyclohydrolase family protein [Acidiplasma sp.]
MEIDEYINNLKSDSAAPGGGSASALTSIFSASLNSMASLLSLKKEKLRENYGKYNNIVLQSNKIIDDLKSLMNEDEKNFMDIMDALRISRNDKNRPNKINYAVKKSIITSWKIAIRSLINLENAVYLLYNGNKNLVTDDITSAYMAYSSINASLGNIAINLGIYKGSEYIFTEKLKIKLFYEESLRIFGMAESYEKDIFKAL